MNRRRSVSSAVGALVAAAVAGGVAYATIPGPGNVYSACMLKGLEQRRRVRRMAEFGTGVRYVRSTFLPGDETILHVFDSASAEALHEAARDASLPHERIVEALENGGQREEQEKKP
jgi:hypothetical protein